MYYLEARVVFWRFLWLLLYPIQAQLLDVTPLGRSIAKLGLQAIPALDADRGLNQGTNAESDEIDAIVGFRTMKSKAPLRTKW